MMPDDQQLLRQYISTHSEPAFGEIVSRHIDLVFSAALRMTNGDRSLAQDVTQTVFTDLARKAASLPAEAVLPGWLYRHACFTASKAIRTERRRQAREQTAMEMNALASSSEPAWEQIAPQLEAAMSGLTDADRDALVLRYFQRQDLRTVGATLGISEDAAQKRVSRALEKLRETLGTRGVALTATALGTILISEAVTAAPAGLAISVTTAALTGITAAGAGTAFSLVKLMTMTKLPWAIAGALAIAAISIPLAQNKSLTQLRQENQTLRQQTRDLAKLREQNQNLAKLQVTADELERLRKERAELPRLRAEVTGLRNRNEELKTATASRPPIGPYLPLAKITDAGLATPDAALQTFLWAGLNGNKERMLQSSDFGPMKKWLHEKRKELEPDFDPDEKDHPDDFSFNNINPTPENVKGLQILSQNDISTNQTEFAVAITGADGVVETNRVTLNRVNDEWKVDFLSLAATNTVDATFTEPQSDGTTKTNNLKMKVQETREHKLVPAD